MCLFKNKYLVTQKQVTKQEAGNLFTLFHYIMERWRIHTKGLHLAEILHMQGQNQISIRSCYMICCNIGLIPGEKGISSAVINWEINVCPVLHSPLRCHLKIPQVFFLGQKESANASVSLYITCCKILLSLKHHHRCCFWPLNYRPLPRKLLLITSFLLLFLLAVPSNISMCFLMQCQLGNAASFKAAALSIWWFKKKSGCLFRHYISNLTTTESSS